MIQTLPPPHQDLLNTLRRAYTGHKDMMGFTPFPDDIAAQEVAPLMIKAGVAFQGDRALVSQNYSALHDTIRAASGAVHWRETYKGTDIGDDFLNRFGCYCIIGDNAPFTSQHIRLFMVYMPPHLPYPWHQHPAEEIYMVVSGTAIFRRQGCADEQLFEGDTMFHESNQPHAMQTGEEGVLCLVAWRNCFDTPPVLTG